MKLGVRAHDYGRHSAAELAGILKNEGFGAAQLAVPKAIVGIENYEHMTERDVEEIRTCFEEHGVEITVLGCYIDISSTDGTVRESHLKQFGEALKRCKMMGAGMVGTESSYGILDMTAKERTWNLVEDGVKRLVELAERYGADVGIEPVAAHTLYSPEWTARLLERVGSSRLKVIFDPVNLLTGEMIEQQEELWEICFSLFGEQIAAVHLKDFVVGEEGVFRPCLLGEGLMKFDKIFTWLHREKPDISILREEISPLTAHRDIAFMKKLTASGGGMK